MSVLSDFKRLTSAQRHAFSATFLGWTLDSLDFFLLIFCVRAMAADFHTDVASIMGAVFLTQAFRPVGAILFGLLADRYGRRPVLITNIFSFSLIELGCAFAPTLGALLALRALFGVAMGGEWGVGAALAFETLPRDGRGVFSGILQEGYAVGMILGSILYAALFVHIGWRGLFVVGSLPALLAFYVQVRVPESPVWLEGRQLRRSQQPGPRSRFKLPAHWREFLPTFAFLILLMSAFMSFSHGTQDLYPTFLEVHAHLTPEIVGIIGLLYGVTSIAGGYVFGALSEQWGRKRAIIVATLLAIPVIPLYAYGASALELCIGAMLMQFMVQGAWGVVPAYLNELSPGPVRATAPGVAYTLGGLITSWNGKGQALAAEHWHNYPTVLAWTVVIVALVLAGLAALGREAKGVEMTAV